jgi:hypothetical protein
MTLTATSLSWPPELSSSIEKFPEQPQFAVRIANPLVTAKGAVACCPEPDKLIGGIVAGGLGVGLLAGEGVNFAAVGDVDALAADGDEAFGDATAAVLLVAGCGVAALPTIPTTNRAATAPVKINLVR